MILEVENWYLGYSQILTDCRSTKNYGGSVQIYCSADADSLAATRIITFMLRNDGIPHQLLPCRSYSQLKQSIEKLQSGSSSIRSIILLNLGATRNLTTLFTRTSNDYQTEVTGMLDPESTKVYVFDSRRPVHLANIHASNNIIVYWDVQDADEVPSDGDNLSGNDSSSSSSDDESTGSNDTDSLDEEKQFEEDEVIENDWETTRDGPDLYPDVKSQDASEATIKADEDPLYDAEDESDQSVPMKEKRKRRQTLETVIGSTASVENDSDNESTGSIDAHDSVKESSDQILTQRELFQDRRNRLQQYYSKGTFYGSPASFIAYKMATQLRFGNENADLLWLACVGVTDAYLHSRLDVSGYSTLAIQLRSHVNRLFPNDDFERVTNTVYAEQLDASLANDNTFTRIGFSGNGRILTESDFRFFLLRHFSLLEGMVYSDYISTRFQLSTAKGMHRLQELLAKMGFPLTECQQPFTYMNPKLRRQLQAKFSTHAEEYGLENFEFTSFFRITGYQSLLSASDTSYAITALLEYDIVDVPSEKFNEDDLLLRSFNLALDALNTNTTPNSITGEGSGNCLVNGGNLSGATGLGAGIRLAMKQQKSIMATALSLVDRAAITRLNHFRYAYITCSSHGEHGSGSYQHQSNDDNMYHAFAQPLTLTRLAHYLMDMHRENGKWTGTKARPLVLLVEKPRTQTFLVVGYEFPEHAGDLLRNRFGKSFELAAQSMKGTFVFDSFDSNVVEVARGDVQRFIEQLHYLLETLSRS